RDIEQEGAALLSFTVALEEQRSRFLGPHRSYAGDAGDVDVRLSERQGRCVGVVSIVGSSGSARHCAQIVRCVLSPAWISNTVTLIGKRAYPCLRAVEANRVRETRFLRFSPD